MAALFLKSRLSCFKRCFSNNFFKPGNLKVKGFTTFLFFFQLFAVAALAQVNQAPVLSALEANDLRYVEDQAPVAITTTMLVSDQDDINLESATIRIRTNYVLGEDVLSFTNANGISGSWDAAKGILTLSGTSSLANYQRALRSVTYHNTNTINPRTFFRTLRITVNDGDFNSNTLERNLVVEPVNDPPIAVADRYTVAEGGTLNIARPGVLLNDKDPDDKLHIARTSGAMVIDGNAGEAAWSVANRYTLTNVISGTVSSSQDLSASYRMLWDDTHIYILAEVQDNVLINDSPDNRRDDGVEIYIDGKNSKGSVYDANVFYWVFGWGDTTPTEYSKNAINGVRFASQTITGGYRMEISIPWSTIGIRPAANASIGFDMHVNDDDNGSIRDKKISWNDPFDGADEKPYLFGTGKLGAGAEGNLSAILVRRPLHGSIDLRADGSFTYIHNGSKTIRDSFTYKVNDGSADGNTVEVTLNITPDDSAPNQAPTAVNDAYTVDEGAILVIATPGVLANDTDAEAGALTAALVSLPSHGSLSFRADGSFTYVHDGSETTADSFTYKAIDADNSESNIATVSITIRAVNDAPVAQDDIASTLEDSPITVDVLANDSDAEGDALTIISVSPVNGTAVISAGKVIFTPDLNYNGNASFTYVISDGNGQTATAVASVQVIPVNDAPSFTKGADITMLEDAGAQSIAGWSSTISAGPADEADQALTFNVSNDNNGLFSVQPAIAANGTLSFTPAPNAYGSATVTVKLTDDGGTANGGVNESTIQSFTINITPVNDAPDGADNNITTAEDTEFTFTAAHFGFNDVDGNNLLAVKITSLPTAGSLILNGRAVAAGDEIAASLISNLQFIPDANAYGAGYASFTFQVKDDGGTLNGGADLDHTPNTIVINVTPVNDVPVANAASVTTEEDVAVNITLTGTDVEGDALTYTIVTRPAHGALSGTAPSLTYTPNTDYHGSDAFTFTVNDGKATSAPATVSITVTPVNDAPVAVADAYTVNEGETLNIAAPGVLSNDSDVDGNSLTAVLISTTSNGTLTLNVDGSFTYQHNGSETTADSFSYKVNDGTVDGNTVTVSITINPINDAPIAVADNYTVEEGAILNVPAPGVLSNDHDAEGDALSVSLISSTTNGTLRLAPDGSFVYEHNGSETVADSFVYRINDGTLDGNTATVSITITPVNDAPLATNDAYTVDEGATLVIAAPGVLANDTDAEADALSAVLVSPPSHGSLSLRADGSFTYVHDGSETTADSFTYKAKDAANAESNIATVSITINAVNDAPVAMAQTITTDEDVATAITLTGSDAENSPLSFTVVTQPTHGALSGTAPNLIYTPHINYFGTDSFTFIAHDGTESSAAATVSIIVRPVNDAPVAVDDEATVDEDQALNGTSVLANDTDADDDALTVVLVSEPANGTINFNSNGTYTYTPFANYFGRDSFTYKAVDAANAESNNATVVITINAINDAPVAADDNYTTNQDEALTVAVPGVLVNDTDVEADALSALLVTNAAHGTLALNVNGSFTYTPAAGFSGTDTFSYKVNDGTADGNTATVRITVVPAEENRAPLAVNDSFTGRENEVLSGNVLLNDSDPEGEALSVDAALIALPTHGTVVLHANGNFTYTPNPNFNGQDQFTYRVCDASSACANAVVFISILPYDSDKDGIPDVVEWGQDASNPVDTDDDNTPDYLDTDADNDGIPDRIEAGADPRIPVDTDGDGLPDYLDLDSDGDGKADEEEGTEDCDADGIPNYLDNNDPCQEKILISQGFSPNGDGNNDFWKIFLIEKFPSNKIQIYNRWGALVFSMDGYDNESKVWTGESNQGSAIGGNKLTDGTYFYLINLGDGSKTYTGYVVIRR